MLVGGTSTFFEVLKRFSPDYNRMILKTGGTQLQVAVNIFLSVSSRPTAKTQCWVGSGGFGGGWDRALGFPLLRDIGRNLERGRRMSQGIDSPISLWESLLCFLGLFLGMKWRARPFCLLCHCCWTFSGRLRAIADGLWPFKSGIRSTTGNAIIVYLLPVGKQAGSTQRKTPPQGGKSKPATTTQAFSNWNLHMGPGEPIMKTPISIRSQPTL